MSIGGSCNDCIINESINLQFVNPYTFLAIVSDNNLFKW